MERTNTSHGSPGGPLVDPADVDAVLALFGAICDRTTELLVGNDDWSHSAHRAGQYAIDVGIDTACLEMIHASGLAVLSEETGVTRPEIEVDASSIVVVDPLDGSTNAALGLPWCATALCLVTNGLAQVAMVANLRTGDRYSAIRGRGAMRNGCAIEVGTGPDLADAIIAVNARPPDTFRPAQFRAMGATALDIASVAGGDGFDGSIDFDDDRIGVWDYLAAVFILEEAGGCAADALGRELITLDHAARRRPVTARSRRLLDQLLSVAD